MDPAHDPHRSLLLRRRYESVDHHHVAGYRLQPKRQHLPVGGRVVPGTELVAAGELDDHRPAVRGTTAPVARRWSPPLRRPSTPEATCGRPKAACCRRSLIPSTGCGIGCQCVALSVQFVGLGPVFGAEGARGLDVTDACLSLRASALTWARADCLAEAARVAVWRARRVARRPGCGRNPGGLRRRGCVRRWSSGRPFLWSLDNGDVGRGFTASGLGVLNSAYRR